MAKKTDIPDVFKELDKINTDGALLSENALSVVDSWIDTGSYALNAIVSGSLYKGIPEGRVVGFAGPSGCGKTLMSTKIIGNFLSELNDCSVKLHQQFLFDFDLCVVVGSFRGVVRVDSFRSCYFLLDSNKLGVRDAQVVRDGYFFG